MEIEVPEVVHFGWFGRFFPFGFFYEFRKLLKLALPITMTSLIAFLSGPISIIFCGHLGKSALAAVGLAVSLFNVAGFAVVIGLLTATDTLFAQTFGSPAKWMMGVQLQRAFVIITFCCFPCAAVLMLAGPILLLLKQNPVAAISASNYLLYMIPGLWFASYAQLLNKYIQTQNRVIPPLLIGIVTNVLNALLHYLLLFVGEIGIKGSAISQVTAYVFQCIVLVSYICVIERKGVTWHGWTRKLWYDWSTWFKLAMPGVFMTTLEWTIFELGSLVAGTMGEKELATQAILFNVEAMCYTLLPLGFGLAVSIRLGQFLGVGSAVGPRSVISVGLVSIWLAALCFVLGIVLLRWQIPKIFTHDKDVIDLAAGLLPLVATFQIFDGSVGVCSGAIRGAGLQYIGAIVCFVTLYVIGAPIGLVLVYWAGMKLNGLWAGLTVGTILEGVMYFFICQCINWEKQVRLAKERTTVTELPIGTVDKDTGFGVANDGYLNERIDVDPNLDSGEESMSVSDICYLNPSTTDAAVYIPHKEDNNIFVSRLWIIMLTFATFVITVCLRAFLPWSQYFGSFCVFPNGTFAPIQPGAITPYNCSIITPGSSF